MTDRHIGNLLVSLYAIESVYQRLLPQQTLCCVVDYNLLPLARYLLPEIDFIGCTVRGSKLSIYKKILLFIKMLYRVRRKHIDTAVDLYGHGESYAIARLSGARYISAYSYNAKTKSRYNWNGKYCEFSPKHQIDFYLFPFMPLLGLVSNTQLNAPRLTNIVSSVEQKLNTLGVAADKPLVIVHPGAGKEYKLWPTKHWQALIKKLEQAGKQVLLIGAGVDKVQLDTIVTATDIAPIDGFGQFDLIETIHLGFIAEMMVGNDSGPTHLMATTPTTVVSLFGPTDHTLWSPLSTNSHIVTSPTPCLAACSKQVCQRQVSCLEDLTPDQVFEVITDLTINGVKV